MWWNIVFWAQCLLLLFLERTLGEGYFEIYLFDIDFPSIYAARGAWAALSILQTRLPCCLSERALQQSRLRSDPSGLLVIDIQFNAAWRACVGADAARTPTSRPSSAVQLLFMVTADDLTPRNNTGGGYFSKKPLTTEHIPPLSQTVNALELRVSHLLVSFLFKIQLVLLLLRLRFDHPAEETEAPSWRAGGRRIRVRQQSAYAGYTHWDTGDANREKKSDITIFL